LILGVQGEAGSTGITGAAGIAGKDGSIGKDGKTLWNGVKDPESTWGAPGDMFINSVTKTLFGPKDLTTGWPIGVSMVGPAGAVGATGAQGPGGASGGSGPAGPAGNIGATGAAGSNATLTCAQGGTCVLGDTGPGGGFVFIVRAPTPAAPWRYMEAAPANWHGETYERVAMWCSNLSDYVPSLENSPTNFLFTSTVIGAGFSNSQKMIRGCAYGMANSANAYNGGGKSDWYLPSRDELNELHPYARAVGAPGEGSLWSSSEITATKVWSQECSIGLPGTQFESNKGNGYFRPVRSF